MMQRRLFLARLLKFTAAAASAPLIVPVVKKIVTPDYSLLPFWTETSRFAHCRSEQYQEYMDELYKLAEARRYNRDTIDIFTDLETAKKIKSLFFQHHTRSA